MRNPTGTLKYEPQKRQGGYWKKKKKKTGGPTKPKSDGYVMMCHDVLRLLLFKLTIIKLCAESSN